MKETYFVCQGERGFSCLLSACSRDIMIEVIYLNEHSILHEVFVKMKNNPHLSGSFEETDGRIVWRLFDGYILEIASEYIGINKELYGKMVESTHHWHPDDEDLYEEVCLLGTRGNVTVIHLFGLGGMMGSSIVYQGPTSKCPIKRKWLFGKYIYLYAE